MESPSPLAAFLATVEPFSLWGEAGAASLEDLAGYCRVWAFTEGDLVRFPDEAPDGWLWVREGSLAVLEDQRPRWVGPREALIAGVGVWVRGQSSGTFVTVSDAGWRCWLRRHPEAAARLGLAPPPRLPRGLGRSPLALEPGEAPVAVYRRAPWFPVLRSLVPGAFALAFVALGLVLQFVVAPTVPPLALWAVPGVGILLASALIALAWWEWSVSVLAVTNRSVLVRQVDLWNQQSLYEKLDLGRLREAIQTRSGWVEALLGLVTVELEGDSPRGRLKFGGLARSTSFLKTVEDLRPRTEATDLDRRTIRRALADRSGGARAPRCVQEPSRSDDEGPRPRASSWRVETSDAVWFRRHWWPLGIRSLPWWAATLAVGVVGAWLLRETGGAPAAWVGALAALSLPVGRWAWEWADWFGHRLCIQGDRLLVVHRQPLWLGERRQEAPLAQIEQVGLRKDGLVALLGDFGTLTIGVGGAEPLVFADAAHPEWVQNEIFHRRSLAAADQRRAEVRSRLNEVGEILDTWDQARQAGYFEPHQPQETKEDR